MITPADRPRNDHPTTIDECETAISLQFPPDHLRWVPVGRPEAGKVAAAPAPADPFIQSRLDYVFGKAGWSVEFRPDPAAVVCRLTVLFPGATDTITRCGMGRDVQSPDSYSEGFRLAAAQLGVGRYLMAYPPVAGLDWDGSRVVAPPKLNPKYLPPGWRPAGVELATAAATAVRKYCDGNPGHTAENLIGRFVASLNYYPDPAAIPLKDVETRHVEALAKKYADEAKTRETAAKTDPTRNQTPKTGPELLTFLTRWDADIARKKMCAVGELVAAVAEKGYAEKYGEVAAYNTPRMIEDALAWAFEFEAARTEAAKPAGKQPAKR